MNKFLTRISWIIIVVPFIYLVVVWNRLPGKIAMHFDIHGNADKYSNKNGFLFFMVIMASVSIGLYFLLPNIYRIDPKKFAADNKGRLQKIAFALVIFLAALQCFIIYTAVSGSLKLDVHFVFASIGIFWAVIGNYMNNIKPNYFAGFRLPWTLENAENWKQTHLVAGKLWFAGGLLIAVICLFAPRNVMIIAFLTIAVIITITPIIYSYLFYRKHKTSN
jgi:uncharacterized membrane protein